jgi:hypothetical protein
MKIAKKSYEISYALFRIAENLKNKNFSDHLEYQALRLLTSSALSDFQSIEQTLKAIETILRFGADVNVISHGNKELILAAIGELNSIIDESRKAAKAAQEFNLDDIFSPLNSKSSVFRSEDERINFQESGNNFSFRGKNSSGIAASILVDAENNRQENSAYQQTDKSSEPVIGNSAFQYNNEATPVAAYNRQSAILERIKQNNDCRLKDIQEILPNVSERTIRYDLQKLCEQGMVERVGNGGPGGYYKLKQAVAEKVAIGSSHQ